MHLLLPPSESKSGGGRGTPLRARHYGVDPLSAARTSAIAALLDLVTGSPVTAAEALLLPASVSTEALAANANILDTPTMPALRRYTGVVYDGLGYGSLTPAERRFAQRVTLIFSGLFGVVRGSEAIPAYRVPAKAVLPRLGVAAAFWRPVLGEVLAERLRRGLIIDLRSGDYAAMWRPPRTTTERVVTVQVLSPALRGGHAVISYRSKYAKGQLAAELIRQAATGTIPRTVGDVSRAWLACETAVGSEASGPHLDLYTT